MEPLQIQHIPLTFVSFAFDSMTHSIELSQTVQNQLAILIERYKLAVEELERMSVTLAESEANLAQTRKELAELAKGSESLKWAQGAGGSAEDRAALKAKINEWVREINTCIARLNA